jgi:hypothetical protein
VSWYARLNDLYNLDHYKKIELKCINPEIVDGRKKHSDWVLVFHGKGEPEKITFKYNSEAMREHAFLMEALSGKKS